MSGAKGTFTDMLDEALAHQGDVPMVAPEPGPVPLIFPAEHVSTLGMQLIDLRGFNNFRMHVLLPTGQSYSEIDWPKVLSLPGAKPGQCLNSATFEVKQPKDVAPRKFVIKKRTTYGEQIFNEVKI